MRILNFVSQLFLVVLLLLSSCKKEEEVSEDNTSKLPVLSTLEVTDVLQESASSGGMVLSDGGYTVLAKGVCWSTNQTPTINDSKTDEGSGAGAFSSTITNLTPNSTYYVRAYARNSYGVGYGSTMSFTTMAILTDVDGNTYDIVKIGNQVWMAENLKTTKFNDNNSIPLVTDSLSWINISSAAYCWPQNSQGYGNAYGVLYNWYTVSSDKLCPLGWHVPSNAEWTELSDYLGG
ncbi:MAG: hypothetical protein JXR53_12925 [Bacteroidales bacterium]|nr:hypothetical protein [Bacteroidales bacterium]